MLLSLAAVCVLCAGFGASSAAELGSFHGNIKCQRETKELGDEVIKAMEMHINSSASVPW